MSEQITIPGKSGARSSKIALRFDLIPPIFINRTARRFTIGFEKYGEGNYQKGLRDREFLQDRLNHLQEHLYLFLKEGNEKDDNLAAIAWCVSILMEAEERGTKFPQILKSKRIRKAKP